MDCVRAEVNEKGVSESVTLEKKELMKKCVEPSPSNMR